MSPLEQREGRSLWVMRGGDECRGEGVVRVVVCVCVCASARVSKCVGMRVCKRSRDGGGRCGGGCVGMA